MRTNIVAMALLVGLACPAFAGDDAERWRELSAVRDAYRKALNRVHTEHGGAYMLPAIDFFLFGMGSRDKYLYANGQLRNALTDEVVLTWTVEEELIVPPSYVVAIKTKDGKYVRMDGTPSKEVDAYRQAAKPLHRLYGHCACLSRCSSSALQLCGCKAMDHLASGSLR